MVLSLSNFLAAFTLLSLVNDATAGVLSFHQKRQSSDNSSNVFVPVRVNLPLQYASTGKYLLPVQMSNGSDAQHFNFTISTGSGLTYVGGDSCSSCSGVTLYNQSASSTAQSFSSSTDNTTFLTDNTSGPVIKEVCSIQSQNGTQWVYPNQTVISVNQQTPNGGGPLIGSGGGVSGIVGLGANLQQAPTPSSSAFQPGFSDSIYAQWLNNNPTALNFSFGMDLKPPTGASQNYGGGDISLFDGGNLDWLQPDPSKYDTSQVQWKSVSNAVSGGGANTTANSTAAQDWTVALDGFVFVDGDNQLQNSRQVVGQVEPMYPNMYLPLDEATLIHATIPGSQQNGSFATLGSTSTAWTVPCNSQFSFGFVVGSQTFTLDPGSLLINQGNGICTTAIEGWTNSNQEEYLLGARFISSVYLIFQIGRDGSQTVGFAPRAFNGSSSHTGAIVGGVLGGIGGAIIVAALIFMYLRHRRHRRENTPGQYDGHLFEAKPDGSNGVVPFTMGAPGMGPTSTTGTQHSGIPLISPSTSHALAADNSPYVEGMMPPAYDDTESSFAGGSSSNGGTRSIPRVPVPPVDRKVRPHPPGVAAAPEPMRMPEPEPHQPASESEHMGSDHPSSQPASPTSVIAE
ncbi:hypothetical protein EIP91_010166 [Steccherinum ochraceum]|uniref:Peptidase A1 domain-containing protein n=1 Tax=Steccherinum ochraceum TaxID=92696 RepID=A0A4R0RRD8_9APHY|nr:hypothetical protein EIP91_010166 [Steccherinum ochraceum]